MSCQDEETREPQSIALFLELIVYLDELCLIYYLLLGLLGGLGQLEEHAFYLLACALQLEGFVDAFLLVRVVDEYCDYVLVEEALFGQFLGALEVCHYFEEAALQLQEFLCLLVGSANGNLVVILNVFGVDLPYLF